MSLCSEISQLHVPHWNSAYSVFNDDNDKDSVLLFPELLFSPLNKSLVIKTSDSWDVVSVGEYKVKASLSSTLQSIFDKYGDITSNSKLQSLSTRTYHLETLAEVVIELQSTPLRRLSESRATEILAIVDDIETAKIRVGWLRSVLEEVLEATRYFDRREMVVMEKKACEHGILLAKQEMELSLKKLAEKEKEMKEFRERLMKTTGKLGSLEMKRTCLDKRFVFLRSKVEKFQGQSVFQDIL
ncbi:Phospholipase-like [Arabidopsis suecica]|uniref:Phospholipase-like n=1 Tax=Arabidopsis suecica TaxID=45249 RepID=A0A8T2DEZ7_ARASU|nr:Phospholipase-like [Arabidopsis suecica]